jgi:protein-tyrosine phosphatase
MSHTQIIPGLWMGGQITPIADATFPAILNLRYLEDVALLPLEGFLNQQGQVMLWLPLMDVGVPVPDWKIRLGANFIHRAMVEGKNVLVHCGEGRNRSGLMVAAYMVLYEEYAATQAIEVIRSERENALTNETFVKQIMEL